MKQSTVSFITLLMQRKRYLYKLSIDPKAEDEYEQWKKSVELYIDRQEKGAHYTSAYTW